MARHSKHDAPVDPFNAGEPTLPWGEPDAFDLFSTGQNAEECAFGDAPYNSPTKQRDNYDAPDPDDPRMPRDDESARERKRRIAAERKSARRAAAAAPKGGEPKRKRSLIKAVIIFVVVVNLLPVVFGLIGLVFDGVGGLFDGLTSLGTSSTQTSDPHEDDRVFESDVDEAEQECIDAVVARLDLLQTDTGDETQRVAAFLNETFEQGLGYTADELGIDAQAFAELITGQFAYEIDSCFVYDDGTATVYFNSWGPSAGMIAHTAHNKIFDLFTSEGVFEGDTRPVLSQYQQDRIRALFAEAIDEQGSSGEDFSSVGLILVDGTWTVDEDDLAEEVDMALGIW